MVVADTTEMIVIMATIMKVDITVNDHPIAMEIVAIDHSKEAVQVGLAARTAKHRIPSDHDFVSNVATHWRRPIAPIVRPSCKPAASFVDSAAKQAGRR